MNEYGSDPEATDSALEFFYSLPLWLELDGIRIVHACWDDQHIDVMQQLTSDQRLNHDLLVEASQPGSLAYKAVETLLKGVEVKLPDGITFNDKDGHPRNAVRIRWWDDKAQRLGDVALLSKLEIGNAADLSIPDHAPAYSSDDPPCFIGHYWLTGTPEPLTPKIACVDYSVAKGGRLVAYRWSGEQELNTENFTYV